MKTDHLEEPHEQTQMEVLESMANARKQQIAIPRSNNFTRQQVVQVFEDSFELIGGIPRLAAWGHEHPGEFFKLYAKLLPASSQKEVTHGGKVVIEHALQPGALDTMPAHMDEKVIEHDAPKQND